MNSALTIDTSIHESSNFITPMIMVRGVEKTYPNGTNALQRLDLNIARGEIVSLLGPSGCGKSTLLKMFADLEQPSAGLVRWNGKAEIQSQCKMAMVFQEATLMPWANIAENVRLPLDLQHISKSTSTPKVMAALKAVGLENFSRAYPRELSGGDANACLFGSRISD